MIYEVSQVLILVLLTLFFLKDYKKNVIYLLLGYGFFFVALILQVPFHYLDILIMKLMNNSSFIPALVLSSIAIIVSELTKYFSLKKFLPTKGLREGKAFVFAWVSLESLNFLTVWFYSSLFAFFNMTFSFSPYIIEKNIPLFNFTFFLLFNLAISMIVLKSVLRKNSIYLIFAILLSISLPILLTLTTGLLKFIIIFLIMIYSLSLIYRFWK